MVTAAATAAKALLHHHLRLDACHHHRMGVGRAALRAGPVLLLGETAPSTSSAMGKTSEPCGWVLKTFRLIMLGCQSPEHLSNPLDR